MRSHRAVQDEDVDRQQVYRRRRHSRAVLIARRLSRPAGIVRKGWTMCGVCAAEICVCMEMRRRCLIEGVLSISPVPVNPGSGFMHVGIIYVAVMKATPGIHGIEYKRINRI